MLQRCLCSLLIPAVVFVAAAGDAVAGNCTATFRLDSAVTIGALQYEVDYPTATVDFDGSGTSVACSDPTGSFTTFNDDDAGLLSTAYVSFSSFTGPTDVAVCDLVADPGTTVDDFIITVTDAADDNADPINPMPSVSLSSLSCEWSTTSTSVSTTVTSSSTTSTSTTSTTLGGGGSTTSTTLWATSSTSTSTTMPEERLCLVDIALADAVTVGSLQFEVDYSGAGGTFEGEGSDVTCSGEIQYSLSSFNDNDAGEILTTAIIKLGAFSGPTLVAGCVFVPGGVDPVAGDFAITVTDAADGNTDPIDPPPAVVIDSVGCFDPNATTTTSTSTTSTTSTTVPVCGDGIAQAGEACDDGGANSDTQPDACRLDCTLPACGDDVTDSGESCDDGAGNSDTQPDACRLDCTVAACGDDVTDSGESCDDGAGNSDTQADACRLNCTAPACGDDVTDSGESCDDGAGNSDTQADACRLDCTVAACGDGVTDSGESCDDGAGNSDTAADACRLDCTVAACGDGVIDAGEECDDGAANSDADPGTCRSDCSAEYLCGDADDSGAITATDANIVLQAAVGLIQDCEPGRCDTSGDGITTVSDAQLLLLNAVGLSVELRCTRTVVVRLEDAVTLGALGFDVDYSAVDTAFLGDGSGVACTSLLDGGAIVAFNNDSASSTLSVSIADLGGFSGPVDVATCMLREHSMVAGAGDLLVTTVDATDPGAQPVAPVPAVSAGF